MQDQFLTMLSRCNIQAQTTLVPCAICYGSGWAGVSGAWLGLAEHTLAQAFFTVLYGD